MRSVLLFITVVLFISHAIAADWYRIEGKYASVEFTEGYESTADSILKIAELALPRLAEMVNLPLSDVKKAPARIILSDAMDISNGYSIENTVVIYTISSMYLPMWTGNIPWYNQVLTHELAHFITFKKLKRGGDKIFGQIGALNVPRWFYEGVAQYLSETWNTFRGDIYLRNALLSGKFNLQSLYNIQDGRLLYASGHAFVRYLVTEYGDSSLINLMDYDKQSWFYDFNVAFKKVYKKSVSDIFPQLYRNLVIYYGDRLADYPVLEFGHDLPDFGGRIYQLTPLSASDSTYLISRQVQSNQLYLTASIVQIKDKKRHTIEYIGNNYNTGLILSPDDNLIAYGRYNLGAKNDQNSLDYRWYIYDRSKAATTELTTGVKAKYGVFLKNRQLILLDVRDRETVFLLYDYDKGTIKTFYSVKMQVGVPERSADGGILFSAQDANGRRDLYLLETGKLRRLTNDIYDNRRPLQIDKEHILFNRLVDNKAQLALFDLQTSRIKTLVDAQDDYWIHAFDKRADEIILSYFDPLKKIGYLSVSADSLLIAAVTPRESFHDNRYARWTKKEPQAADIFSLPDTAMNYPRPENVRLPQFSMINIMNGFLPLYTKSDGWGVGAATIWAEALQRQALSGMVAFFGTGWENSFVLLNSLTRAYNSFFSLAYYHGPVIFAYYENGQIVSKQDLGDFTWAKPLNISGNRRLSLSPMLSYTYRNFITIKDYLGVPSQFSYNGPTVSLGFDYNLPTTFYPALAKRHFNLTASYFNSFETAYKFSITEFDMTVATNLLSERIGIMATGTYLNQNGNFPLGNGVGVDGYYELDMPRDYTYTRTVRGISRNLYGNKLLWASGELIYYLAKNSQMALLFIPITNLTINGFYDYARVENSVSDEVYSYGAQLSFGEGPVRFGAGYVESFYNGAKDDIQFYWRISLLAPKRLF